MASKMDSSVPSDLFDRVSLCDIENEARDFSLINGIVLRSRTFEVDTIVEQAPVTIFPSPFPRKYFEQAVSLQKDVNLLMHRMSYDHDFLKTSLERTVIGDEFTRNLFNLYETVEKEGRTQPISLGLNRADYMLDVRQEELELKQVEVNTISTAFAFLGPKLSQLHRHIVSKYGKPGDLECLPENKCDVLFAQALIDAWEVYGTPGSVILFVVEDTRTISISDQRSLEFKIGELRPDVRVVRRTFAQLLECAKLRDNQRLFIDHNDEVAIVYYRYGYLPEHYSSPEFWNLRHLLERSRAIKCPSLGGQLTGAKKIQQVLCDKTLLEKFLDTKAADRMYPTFAGIWSLDKTEQGNANYAKILQDPENYVLKPQREGGGNNIYGEDVKPFLLNLDTLDAREAYIAMDHIRPPAWKNLVSNPAHLLDSDSPFQQLNSELGIFGVILGDANSIILNRESGHMMRSKRTCFNEANVVSGPGAIDSPYLF
ncbi:Glutathione synthetase [Halotydeus destructor]|nr:Glutathione synthetase [Halotydeus destructor]